MNQSLYRERVAEAGYTIPYERLSHCIHALLTVSAIAPACPQALMSAVKLSEAQTLNHTERKSYVHMQDPSVPFFTMKMNVFSFYLIGPLREILSQCTEFSYFVRK